MKELIQPREPKHPKMKSIGTRISLADYDELEALAKEKNTSIADILKQLVQLLLEDSQGSGS